MSTNGNGNGPKPAGPCRAACHHPKAIEGRCNAHNKARSSLCHHYPMRGKNRCNLHGQKGGDAAPTGPANGKWKTGRYARKIVPLNPEESKLREEFLTEGYRILEQVADAKLVARRALGYSLETGELKYALEALRTVATVAESGKRIAEGALVRVVLDEAVIGVFAEKVIEILTARVPDRTLIALVARDLAEVDWSGVVLPSIAETASATGERT